MEKRFVIKCSHCAWSRLSTGISEDLKDLHELTNSCSNCGKPREFRCPRCGKKAKQFRLKGNS